MVHMCIPWTNPEEGTGGDRSGPPPPGKSQVGIGFLRYTDTDPPQEGIGPGSNSFSREVRTALCKIC